jgi:hypothetical protein
MAGEFFRVRHVDRVPNTYAQFHVTLEPVPTDPYGRKYAGFDVEIRTSDPKILGLLAVGETVRLSIEPAAAPSLGG